MSGTGSGLALSALPFREILSCQVNNFVYLSMASDGKPSINVSGEARHDHKCWRTIVRQEKKKINEIVNLNGQIFPKRQHCGAALSRLYQHLMFILFNNPLESYSRVS